LWVQGGITPGEQLYSPKGSQSAIVSEHNRHRLKLEIDDFEHSVFLLDVYSHKWGNKFFELRNIMAADSMSTLELRNCKIDNDQDVIVSIPMYAIMAGVSINELNFETYNLRVKEEFAKEKDHMFYLHGRFTEHMSRMESLAPEEDKTYKNFFVFDFWLKDDAEHFQNNSKKLDSIFSIIVMVSMGLCFFTLTSSMSANIYDQCKEITIMRSVGVQKNFIVRVYIYESVILILSSSISGFIIGITIGNLMIM